METLTLDHLKALAQRNQSPCISIYLPTHRAGQETQQDPIRFKNLLGEAETQLEKKGFKPRELDDLLQPARALLEDAVFWNHHAEGLAVFIAAEYFHTYRLAISVSDTVVVASSYYMKPLFPLFTNNGHYYILAISQDEVRLFECTRHSIGQVMLPDDTPQSLNEALQLDDPEKQLQFHTGTVQGGIRSGMFHGHGGGEEEQKDRIERYLNQLDASLKPIFREQRTPIVLAGVDYLLPIYRKVSEYDHIMSEGITGSPDQLRPEELQEQAWSIVEPHFRQELDDVIAQYRELAGTETGRASDRLEEVVTAAFYGRVDRLVIAVDTPVWGRINAETGEVTHSLAIQNQDENLDLLEFAAMQTLDKGGTVYALKQDEMPTSSPIVGILRY